MASEVWGWMVNTMTKLTENMKEYKRKWEAEHKEIRRMQNREAVKRYTEKKLAEDEEGFRAYHNEIARATAKKSYAKKRASMTPEELEEYRRKTRERVAAIRKKKKAEEKASGTEEDTAFRTVSDVGPNDPAYVYVSEDDKKIRTALPLLAAIPIAAATLALIFRKKK